MKTLTALCAVLCLAGMLAGAPCAYGASSARAPDVLLATHDAIPFPASLARYQARLFELVAQGTATYDASYSRQLEMLVRPLAARENKFLDRVTSGPATLGSYHVAGGRGYVHHAVCQARQCDRTTMDLLFDPATHRMVALVQDDCQMQWLGNPRRAERALLRQRSHSGFRASTSACVSGLAERANRSRASGPMRVLEAR